MSAVFIFATAYGIKRWGILCCPTKRGSLTVQSDRRSHTADEHAVQTKNMQLKTGFSWYRSAAHLLAHKNRRAGIVPARLFLCILMIQRKRHSNAQTTGFGTMADLPRFCHRKRPCKTKHQFFNSRALSGFFQLGKASK